MMSDNNNIRVAIIGGGLVGAVTACFLGKRGFTVDLYEGRPDIRKEKHVEGKSINMALSVRGIEALRRVDLEQKVADEGIPMRARMIHNLDGSTRPIQYGTNEQYIMSISRRRLNEILLDGTEKYKTVTIHFGHKVNKANFETGELEFLTQSKNVEKRKCDIIIGADGAFSTTRRELMKAVRMDFQQEYIPHGYLELSMPPTKDNEFAMGVNYLHIWPRNEFMMIALPNMDKTYTCTLFMPFEKFESITTDEQLMEFYKEVFPDSIDLIGEEALKHRYFHTTGPLPLVTVKCSPYNYKGKGVIIGDAAHAMVPFYGQGMNAGFEDVTLLDDLLEKYNGDFNLVLPEYTTERHGDACAICDLALYNYIEMRKSVNSKLFLMRKKLDNFLHWLFPSKWVPLYTMVSFTRTRYSKCIADRARQDKILTRILWGTVITATGACAYSYFRRSDAGIAFNWYWSTTEFLEKLGIRT